MSTVFVMAIGVTMVAVAVAEAVDCPKELIANPANKNENKMIFFMVLNFKGFLNGLKKFNFYQNSGQN